METHPFDCEQLITYAAGDSDAAAADAVEGHLRGCAECTELVRHYRLIRSIVLEDDTQAPPAATLARAQALFQPRKRSLAPSWLQPLLSGPPLARVTLLAVCVLAIALALGGARVVAQQTKHALPGDAFYPVKTAWEDAHVAMTLDSASKVQVQLSMAETRVTEMETLAALGRYDLLPLTAKDFEGHLQDATAALGQAAQMEPAKKVELAKKVETDLVQYTQALTSLQETTPSRIKPVIEHAVQVSDAFQTNVKEQLAAPSAPTLLPTTGIPPATLTPFSTDTSLPPPVTNTLPLPATNTPLPTGTPLPAPTNTPEPSDTNTPMPPPTATSTPLPTATGTAPPTVTTTPLPSATSTQPAVIATPSPASTPTPAATTLTATQVTSVPSTPTGTPQPSNTPPPRTTSTPAAVVTGTPTVQSVIAPTLPGTTPAMVTVTAVASPTLAPRSEEITPVGLMWDVTRVETQGSTGSTETSGSATEADGSLVGQTIRTDARNAGPVSSADSAACVGFDPSCARALMPILFSACVASGGLALGMFAAFRRPGSE